MRPSGVTPSARFLGLLNAAGLADWTRSGSRLSDPRDGSLDPVAIRALRRLVQLVDLSASQPASERPVPLGSSEMHSPARPDGVGTASPDCPDGDSPVRNDSADSSTAMLDAGQSSAMHDAEKGRASTSRPASYLNRIQPTFSASNRSL